MFKPSLTGARLKKSFSDVERFGADCPKCRSSEVVVKQESLRARKDIWGFDVQGASLLPRRVFRLLHHVTVTAQLRFQSQGLIPRPSLLAPKAPQIRKSQ